MGIWQTPPPPVMSTWFMNAPILYFMDDMISFNYEGIHKLCFKVRSSPKCQPYNISLLYICSKLVNEGERGSINLKILSTKFMNAPMLSNLKEKCYHLIRP